MTVENEGWKSKNLIAFWIFGVCNNFAYYLMNSAAQDILSKHSNSVSDVKPVEHCEHELTARHCSIYSASLVLFCNNFPNLLIKILYPFIARWVPYGVRHVLVCILQATSLLVVALSDSVPTALIGVMIGAVQCGLGESNFLGLTSHYNKRTIGMYAAGTGMAGLAGSFTYAGLTDPHLVGLTPSQTMIVVLLIPISYFITYCCVLQKPETVHKVSVLEPHAWIGLDIIRERRKSKENAIKEPTKQTFQEKVAITKSLLKYMVPLFLVYFAEYLINQGLTELVNFDCSRGFGTSLKAQYRWYQVLYQVGACVSRSSVNFIQLNYFCIALLPVLQLFNAVFFLLDSIFAFVPHFGIMAAIVLFEGLIGGASYSNSYNHIHKKVDPSIRELALSIVTTADTAGIIVAALVSMPIHNAICALPFYQ